MFGIFDSVETQMRKNAAGWLELAEKVYDYRRDELSEADRATLQQKTQVLKGQLKAKDDAGKLKLGIESLEDTLRRTGGKFYPRSVIQEYVEFFVVAAIVLLGVRAYYMQPFKIPTNSMWPSYYGMTPQVYQKSEDRPGALMKAARFVMFGAEHKEILAPANGKVRLAVRLNSSGSLYYIPRPGKKWFVFPTTVREYGFMVGDKTATVLVPADFNLDDAVYERFHTSREELARKASQAKPSNGYCWVDLNEEATEGSPVLSFDILTGDQLIVDRLSYHFFRPSVGSGFVFRTGGIPELGRDEYYIKRLAGGPGDVLEIKEPALWRNGKPITGAESYDLNANRKGLYRGYFNGIPPSLQYPQTYLRKGEQVTVPAKGYMALGDNSGNSLDSRYWGFVPYKDVVGRPLFVYYPFTRRFGVAK